MLKPIIKNTQITKATVVVARLKLSCLMVFVSPLNYCHQQTTQAGELTKYQLSANTPPVFLIEH